MKEDLGVFVLVFALLALVLGAIGVVQSKLQSVVAWGLMAAAVALTLVAWPVVR